MKTAEIGASLLQAFAHEPDPRAARGRRHPLEQLAKKTGRHKMCWGEGHACLFDQPALEQQNDPLQNRSGPGALLDLFYPRKPGLRAKAMERTDYHIREPLRH